MAIIHYHHVPFVCEAYEWYTISYLLDVKSSSTAIDVGRIAAVPHILPTKKTHLG